MLPKSIISTTLPAIAEKRSPVERKLVLLIRQFYVVRHYRRCCFDTKVADITMFRHLADSVV
ncbi:hypothetical protein KCP73_08015 [Salmonella enterica subsp. enterica]|nr:hypothetical protein KCP73_08015 [Salmonella enterica subsp. enterica]